MREESLRGGKSLSEVVPEMQEGDVNLWGGRGKKIQSLREKADRIDHVEKKRNRIPRSRASILAGAGKEKRTEKKGGW